MFIFFALTLHLKHTLFVYERGSRGQVNVRHVKLTGSFNVTSPTTNNTEIVKKLVLRPNENDHVAFSNRFLNCNKYTKIVPLIIHYLLTNFFNVVCRLFKSVQQSG